MRVKLSYTAEADEVLNEAANLIGNLGVILNETVEGFKLTVDGLRDDDYRAPAIADNIATIRRHLGTMDIRLGEVAHILAGYEDYEHNKRLEEREPTFPPPPLPAPVPSGPPSIDNEEVERD